MKKHQEDPLWRNGQIPPSHELGDPDNLELKIQDSRSASKKQQSK